MTTSTNPGNYVDFDEYVGLKLEKTRSTIRTTDLLTASAGVAAMFLGYLLIFIVLDQWVIRDGFGVGWRWTLLSTLMISTIAWLVWKIGLPSFRTVNRLFAAKEIEKAEPGLKSNLLNLIDLKAAGRTVNPSILKALERRAAVRLQEVDVTHAIDHRPLIRTAYVLLAMIVLFCLYAFFSPKKISNSIWRGLLPAAEVPLATRTEILSVKPGDLVIPAHTQSVEVQVDLGGEIPHQVAMLYTTADGKFQRQPVELRVEAEGQTRFKGQLIGENALGLMQDITYVIKAGDAESQPYKITVEQPPSAQIETVRIEFPPYMKLETIEQRQNGQIDAWEGAKVIVHAKTNMPVRSGMIQFLDDPLVGPTGEEIPMSVSSGGRELQGTWTLALRNDGSFPKYYRIDCKTEDGRRDTAPTNHGLTIRPDLPPEVTLIQPDRDIEVPVNSTIPLLIQASDPDFELGYLYLNVEKGGTRLLHDIVSEGRVPRIVLKHDLVLSKLHVAVGDSFELWVESFDNKQPRPNTRNSPKITVRVTEAVSKKEAEQRLAEQQNQRDDKLAEMERETNPEAAEQPTQPEDDSKVGKPEKPQNSNENDPKQEPKSDPAKSDEGQTAGSEQKSTDQNKGDQAGKQTGETGKKNERSSSNRDQRSEDAAQKEKNDRDSESQQPLNSDGSQDDEAIKRLSEKLNRDAKKQKGSNSAEKHDQERPKDSDPSQSEKETDSAKDAADQKQPEAGVETPKKEKPKSSNRQDDKARSEEKSTDQTSDKDQTDSKDQAKEDRRDETKSDETDPESKPSDQADAGSDASKPDKKSDRTEKKDGKVEPKSETSSDAAKDEEQDRGATDQAHENQDQATDENKSKQSDTAKDDKSAAGKPDDKSAKQSDEAQEKDADKSKQATPSDKKSSDDLPAGLNDKSPKQSPAQKSDKSKQAADQTNSETPPGGKEEGSSDAADAKKKTADGTEKGLAKPDRDPKSDPKQTKNENVKRDPSEKPEVRKNDSAADKNQTQSKDKPSSKSDDARKPDAAREEASDDRSTDSQEMKDERQGKPKAAEEDKSGKQKQESDAESQEAESQDSKDSGESGKDSSKSKAKNQATDQASKDEGSSETDSANDSKTGDKSSDKSEKKSNSNSAQGKDQPESGGKDSSGKKNSADKSGDKKQDQSGGKKDADQKDSDKQGSDKKSDDSQSEGKSKSDQPGAKKGGDDKDAAAGGKTAEGQASKSSSGSAKAGTSEGDSKGGGGEVKDGSGSTTEGGDTPEAPAGDEANLEYNRQATELILQKLKKDLERGEVDPELLDQLGWNQDEMKRFADRLSKSLDESKRMEESPEARARQQQFEEMLKNLDLQKSGSQRSGEKEPKRDILQMESKRTPLPPAYRSAYEKFTRDMARQKGAADKKK